MKTSIVALLLIILCTIIIGCKDEFTPAKMEQAASQTPMTKAPHFTLMDQNDKWVTLSGLRDKWVVLYFYPADDTPGCACQATEFTELLTDFDKMSAHVYGVSPDDPATHRKFIEKYKIRINLLSDPDHKMMRQYGAWVDSYLGEKKTGRVIRSTMIIDPDGIIRYHWTEVIPEGHATRVKEKLKELQAEK